MEMRGGALGSVAPGALQFFPQFVIRFNKKAIFVPKARYLAIILAGKVIPYKPSVLIDNSRDPGLAMKARNGSSATCGME
jgi:hypothetical protein